MIPLLVFSLVLSVLFFPCESFADETDGKTVLVGYYENEVFEEGASPDAVKTGYAYEYYRKLSEYTGWNYEYVYGSFNELYEKLLSGEIDLLAGLAKKEDREGLIGYPHSPMGNETYSLVKHDEDTTVTADPKTLSGKKIGALNSAIAEVLAAFLSENGVTAETVLYEDYASLFSDFDKGILNIAAVEGDGAYGRTQAEILCVFGTSDYYLTVNINRPDLLSELDLAQAQLAMEEPGYLSSLRGKYYSTSVSSLAFSTDELDWVNSHDHINVGYLNNYLPYSGTDNNGEATGIIRELMPKMMEVLDHPEIFVRYTAYDSYDKMVEDVSSGEIDAAFPVGGGLYQTEESGLYQSSPVASAATDLIVLGEFRNDDVTHFAVNENNRMQYYYIRTNFPHAKITMYPSIEDCLDAVLSEEAGATTLNGLRTNDILKNRRYSTLNRKPLQMADDRCFGVKIGNKGLLKLINRGLQILGTDYVQKISYNYTGGLYSYSVSDFVQDHIGLILAGVFLVLFLIILLLVRDFLRSRRIRRRGSEYVKGISAEIKTPLRAILGLNGLIREESDDPAVLQYADSIERVGKSLSRSVDNIPDFSQVQAAARMISEKPYSLRELLAEIRDIITLRAVEKGLYFIMDADENLPVELIGDRLKIELILTGLLINAVKYTERGGVKLKMTLASELPDGVLVEASVEDTAQTRPDLKANGKAMDSENALRIAERQLLAMGSELKSERHGEEGTRLFFALRQGVSDPSSLGLFTEAELKPLKPSFTAPDARVLVCDDTPLNLQVICGLLKQNRIQTDTAESGREAIRLFGMIEYDLLFLDSRMPGMDGMEVLSELKKENPERAWRTPVICLTGNVLPNVGELAARAGFSDHLTKPVKREELERVLLTLLPAEKIIEASEGGIKDAEK